jgi:uncharacterized membrane protein YbaN (DUF454 family)
MALEFAQGLCETQPRFDDGFPIVFAGSTPVASRVMSCDGSLTETIVCSAQPYSANSPAPAFPAITRVAVASPELDFSSPNGAAGRPNAAGPRIDCCERTGVIEIHDPRLLRADREAFCRAMVQAAVERFGATRAEVCVQSSTCRLEFEPGKFNQSELAHWVAEAVRAAIPALRSSSGTHDGSVAGGSILTAAAVDGHSLISATRVHSPADAKSATSPVAAATGSVRLADLALIGGSLALAIGGLIVPGIPTLPFLIMTARHAIRVSPGLGHMLMSQPWSAALLSSAETGSGSKPGWRSVLNMSAGAAILAMAFLILQPPMPIVFGLELGLMALLGKGN